MAPEDIINPYSQVVKNSALIAKLSRLNAAIARKTGLQSSDFTLTLTGGDRYRKNGEELSASTGREVTNSSPKGGGQFLSDSWRL
jgi:hypothetical protein